MALLAKVRRCRHSVQLGLHERRTGITCVDNYRARGRKKTEVTQPQLEADIRALVDEHAQADPTLNWNGFSPLVHLVEGSYPKGIKVSKQELISHLEQWRRSDTLLKWDVTITPI